MAELQAKFPGQLETELLRGDRGAFEVTLDGELIYSKLQTHTFPRYGEVPALVVDRL